MEYSYIGNRNRVENFNLQITLPRSVHHLNETSKINLAENNYDINRDYSGKDLANDSKKFEISQSFDEVDFFEKCKHKFI